MISGISIKEEEIKQYLAKPENQLPVDVKNILQKWFTANNELREDPRNTIEGDFDREEIKKFPNQAFIRELKQLCIELENAINPSLVGSSVEVVRKNNKPKKLKKSKNPEDAKTTTTTTEQDPSSPHSNIPPLQRAQTSCLTDEEHIDKAFDKQITEKKREINNKEMLDLLLELTKVVNSLIENNAISKNDALKTELKQVQKKINDSSSNFPHADYAGDIKRLDDSIKNAEQNAQNFILKVKNNFSTCAELSFLAELKNKIDVLYLQYIAGAEVFGNCKGLSYDLKFKALHQEILKIQEDEKNNINIEHKRFGAHKEIKKVGEYFSNNNIDLDDPLNSKLIEDYGYLKRLANLNILKVELDKDNLAAKENIVKIAQLFDEVFSDEAAINSLEAFCNAQPAKKSVVTECINPFREKLKEYKNDTDPYAALVHASFFETAKLSIEAYKNILSNTQFEQFRAIRLANQFNAQSPTIFTRIKNSCKNFYQNHPYISWALIGAGIGLGVFVGGAVAIGVTIATGGTAGAVLAGALVGLLALKVTGSAVVSAGAGAAVAVSVKKCSTACIHQDLDLRVKQGYDARDSLLPVAAPEPKDNLSVHIPEDYPVLKQELKALKRCNPRFI